MKETDLDTVAENSPAPLEPTKHSPKIAARHLSLAALCLIAIVGGLLLLLIPDKYQPAVLIAVVVALLALLILYNPYVGLVMYFLLEYLRPYDILPSLVYFRATVFLIALTTISWAVRFARTKRLVWDNFSWTYFGFVALVGFTVFSAGNWYVALSGFKEMFLLFVIFVVSLNVIRSCKDLNMIVWLLLFIHAYLAIKGIHNYITQSDVVGGYRTSGIVGTSFLGDENDFAMALNIFVPFAFFAMIYSKRFTSRFAAFLILSVLVLGVLTSFSRGGWLGLVAAIGFCLLRTKRRLLSFVAAIAVAGIMLVAAPSEYWEELATIPDTTEDTAETRINYWKAAVRMWLDHPVVGVGAGNGGAHLPDYVTGFEKPETQWGRAFHGIAPQVLAELGAIGLALFIALLYMVFKRLAFVRRLFMSSREEVEYAYLADSVMGGIVAFVVTGTFLSILYYPQLWSLLTLAMVLFHIMNRSPRSDELAFGTGSDRTANGRR